MLNCCTKRPHQVRKNNHKDSANKSSSNSEMPTKSSENTKFLNLPCFKKRSNHSNKSHEDADLLKNQNSDIIQDNLNQPDGPSIAYSESEHLDSLGNLPPFINKYSTTHLTVDSANNNNNNNNNNNTNSNNDNKILDIYAPNVIMENSSKYFVHHPHGPHHLFNQNPTSSSMVPCNLTAQIPPHNTATVATSRRGSLYICRHTDDLIVTPFAQILAALRNVRANFILITNVHSSKEARFGSISTSSHTIKSEDSRPEIDESQKSLTIETLDELEWCLEQLESIQTHRSVSDMASSKFKKILNKELSQYADQTKSGNQISDYICTTFLDKDVDNSEVDSHRSEKRPIFSEGPKEEDENQIDESQQSEQITNREISSNQSTKDESKDHQHPHSDQTDFLAVKSSSGTTQQHKSTNYKDKSQKYNVTFKSNDDNISYLGIICEQYNELYNMLEESIDVWGIDIYKVASLSDNRPLTVVSFALFRKYQLFEKFKIAPKTFLNFISEIERKYRSDVPYHNSTHAADVTQSTNVLLGASPLENVFSDLELMAVIFACIVHDVDHPGVTNQYLINTNDQLALLYNDSSVLENHHLTVAFTALSMSDCDITQSLSKKQRQTFRKMVIDMVLATDMSKHMSLLADLKTMVETKKVAGSGILNLDNYTDRIQILQNMVHCADLSNPTKPLTLYRAWTVRIMEEFFLQGDLERQKKLEISPMCDRETATVEKSQVSFIDFIVHPLWETWSDLVYPEAQDILDTLEENRDWYFNQIPCACDHNSNPQDQNLHEQHN